MLSALGVGGRVPAVRLVVACPAPSPRSVDAVDVAAAARALGVTAIEAPGVSEALDAAVAESTDRDLVLVTGSLYVVGAAWSVLAAAGA